MKNARRIASIGLAAAAFVVGCGPSAPPRNPAYLHPSPVAHPPDLAFEHDVPPPAPPPEDPDPNAFFSTEAPAPPTEMHPAAYVADWKKSLNSMVNSFTLHHGRPPKDLNELVQSGMLDAIPDAPGGGRFDIEPRYHSVVIIGHE